jgi:Tol biopolymer transport system component
MKATLKTGFSNGLCGAIVALIALSASPAAAAPALQLVSQFHPSFAPPAGGNGDSGLPIVSADGRYVLFAGTANNLTLTNNNNSVLPQRRNVFLRDRASGTTTLVSANLAGTGGGNGDSLPMGISTNGQFALFESAAGDLVANDANNAGDVFVRDVVNGTTTLVSVSTNGAGGNGVSRSSVMTPDGQYVAFVSAASNLVGGDTNGIPDVFVRDLQAGTTTLASVGATSTNSSSPLLGSSESPEITPDGRFVIFYSIATNLVPGLTSAGEVYVWDVIGGTTAWASASARLLFELLLGTTNVISYNVCLSANGQYAAFEVSSNGPVGTATRGMVLRYNLASGLTDVVDMNANVPYLSFDTLHTLAMTPDGRFIAFVGNDNGTSGATTAIYLWDGLSDSATLVSGDLSGDVPTNSLCDSPVVTPDGQWVAFISNARGLTTNALDSDFYSGTNTLGKFHAYLCNVPAGTTQLLDSNTNGVGVGVNQAMVPALSADGGVVAFESADLLNDDRHLSCDVFAREVAAGATDLISARQPALPSQTPDGISSLTPFSVSSNGQFVAFYSDADDLVPNDMNGNCDVFVRDLVLGTNLLVSVNTNGFAGDSISIDPAISGDGRYVVFTSSADDLVPGDTNRAQDIFIRDLQAGTTVLVSVSPDGITPGNADSFSPAISADGRYVLFHSKATNLAAGSFGTGIENLFFRDLQTGATYALTSAASLTGVYSAAMTSDGHFVAFIGTVTGTSGTELYVWNSQSAARTYTNTSTFSSTTFPVVSISPNGQKLAFYAANLVLYAVDLVTNKVLTLYTNTLIFPSHSGLQFSADGRFLVHAEGASWAGTQNVHLYDLQTGTNLLVSQNFNSSSAANNSSDSPTISPDGRFVAYRSFANNIVPDDFNNVADVFIYDASNDATILVCVNASGSSTADDRSLQPVFSADGRTLFFQSWASDLSGNDFNNASDIFALDLTALPVTSSGGGSTNSASVFYAQLFPAGSFAPNPVVSWPLASGQTYRVQYKNDLGDPVWQNLSGNITFIGDTGYITDWSPPPDKRFYRIILNP